MAKRTYFTKADIVLAMEYAVSDDRRALKQAVARKAYEKKVINPLSWAASERVITAQDFEDFKEWKQLRRK